MLAAGDDGDDDPDNDDGDDDNEDDGGKGLRRPLCECMNGSDGDRQITVHITTRMKMTTSTMTTALWPSGHGDCMKSDSCGGDGKMTVPMPTENMTPVYGCCLMLVTD